MTLSVVWGILLSTRLLRRIDNPAWLQDVHRFLGGLMLIMVGLHMLSLMLDGWLKFTIPELLVPFATDYRPLGVALGIVAFYLLIAVQGSSLIMHRLPRKFWKGLHYSSFAALLMVSFHAGLSGTDVGALGYKILAFSLIGIATFSIVLRAAVGTRTRRAVKAEIWVPAHDSKPRISPPRIETQQLVVDDLAPIAENVLHIKLLNTSGSLLPIWYPGSHITLHLPNGLERQYSLCGDPADRDHYEIAVLRTDDSAGGSSWIHTNLRRGMTMTVSGPLNNFELEPARDYLFVAGGIGITPIRAMIESLPMRREWKLVYVGRSRRAMAFAEELKQLYPDRVLIHSTEEDGARLALDRLTVAESTHVYTCGPESLTQSVAIGIPHEQLHVEHFTPVLRLPQIPDAAVQLSFTRARQQLTVGADESILEVLERNGMPVLGSCRKGVCGSCEVRVISGTPEHLDSVMDDSDKDALGVMYPCVSRAKTPELVLDL